MGARAVHLGCIGFHDGRGVMPDSKASLGLATLFWIVACGDVVLLLSTILNVAEGNGGRYVLFGWLVEIFLLVVIGIVGAIMVVVARTRTVLAYRVGLALVVAQPLIYGTQYVNDFATTPSAEAQQTGRAYFTRGPERALAEAILTGDGAKVASLALAANPHALGWHDMTFVRLAMEYGHANPDVVSALLRAGASPERDQDLLLGSVGPQNHNDDLITAHNERLLRAMIDAGVDLNHGNGVGEPRFFAALKWPEGLALMLEHGANTEAEDKRGNTAIMWAVMFGYWPSIDVLLAHGARTDHVDHDGKSFRDIVLERRGGEHGELPPQLAALQARLR